MTPERHSSGLPEHPKVLLPGLQYARSLIDTAIKICRAFESEGSDTPPKPRPVKQKH